MMPDALNVRNKIDLNLLDAFTKRFPTFEFEKGVVLSPDRIVGLVNSGFKFKTLSDRTTQYATQYLEHALEILEEANIVEFELESVKGLPMQINPIGGTIRLIIASFSTGENGVDLDDNHWLAGNDDEDD